MPADTLLRSIEQLPGNIPDSLQLSVKTFYNKCYVTNSLSSRLLTLAAQAKCRHTVEPRLYEVPRAGEIGSLYRGAVPCKAGMENIVRYTDVFAI